MLLRFTSILNKIEPIQGSTIKIQLLSARFSKISRTEIVPKTGKKWYFERMRGQYGNERNLLTGYDKKIFEEEYPKDRVIMECSDIATRVGSSHTTSCR